MTAHTPNPTATIPISSCRIFLLNPEKRNHRPNSARVLAFAQVVFNDCLILNVKIIAGNTRDFVAMPVRKNNVGNFVEEVSCLTQQMRMDLETVVFHAYRTALRIREEDNQDYKGVKINYANQEPTETR